MLIINEKLKFIFYILGALGLALISILSYYFAPNLVYGLRKYIFRENPTKKPAKKTKKMWFFVFGVLIIAITFTALADSASSINDNQKMSGDYRVAVVPFSIQNREIDSVLGKDIASNLLLHIRNSIDNDSSNLVITIWGPDELGIGNVKYLSDSEKRAEAVAKIADQVGADLVIYGSIETNGNTLVLTPEYLVHSRDFYQADEILGQYNLGAPITIQNYEDISDRFKVTKIMENRVQVLSQIILGLSYYSIKDYPQAKSELLKADEIESWDAREGKQVLYILLANVALRENDLDSAESYFSKSLDIDNTYARPMTGLANIYYRKALLPIQKSNDPTDLDISLINKSKEYLDMAMQTSNQPPLADIPLKVDFERGEIELALRYGEFTNSFEPAISEFTKVIIAYGNGKNPRILERAAESHARIGLIYSLSNNIVEAIQEYQTAADMLIDYPDRQRVFLDRINKLEESILE